MHHFRLPLKERMERVILLKRDRDQQREETWANASKYFSTWENRVAKFQEWTSNKYYEDSMHSYQKKLNSEEKKRTLESRRQKLKEMLDKENADYRRELDAIETNYQSASRRKSNVVDTAEKIEYLRQRSAELERRKDVERQKEVAVKDFLRWKANSPAVRDIESRYHTQFVKKAWEEQIKEKVERDQMAKDQNGKIEEEISKYRDQQLKKLVDTEEEKKQECNHWKAEISKQNRELKLRDEMSKKLMQQINDISKQQTLLQETIDARERLKKDREQHKLLAKFWGKQTRLKIRALCNERLQSIEDEYKMLEYLKHLDDKRLEDRVNANNPPVSGKIDAVRQCLEDHRKREIEREKESASLFEEEAKAFLRQQEIVWEKERIMRENLMQEVISTLEKQIEEKRLANQKNQESIENEKERILMEIEERDKQIQAEEAAAHQRIEEMKTELTQQIYEKRKQKEKEMLESLDMLTRLKFEDDQEKLFVRGEESRLKLDGYKPKFHGFKKLAW